MDSEETKERSFVQQVRFQGKFPLEEGEDFPKILQTVLQSFSFNQVIDFGCGTGRLTYLFPPEKYLGLDIDSHVLQEAKIKNPKYKFAEILKTDAPRYADLYFAYMVFFFLSNRDLHEVLTNIRCQTLLVGEVLGRNWRDTCIPNIYHRDLEEYIHLLRKHDFILEQKIEMPHPQYTNSNWYRNKDTNISFLVFKKLFCKKN